MRRKQWVRGMGAVVLTAGMAFASDRYEVDPTHATIGFEVSHLVISKVRGHFKEYSASLQLDEDGTLLEAEAVIQTKSIDTGVKKRDEHLRNADFFDISTYPEITFKSTSIEDRDGTTVMIGDLAIHGVSKQVEMPYKLLGPIKDPWGNTKIRLEASTTVNRADFGLTWNKALEAGGVVVSEKVELQINLEAAKQ